MTPYPLLLSRPLPQSERFADQYRTRLGADVQIVISPVLEICALPDAMDMQGVTGLVFTSENAVRQFAAREALRDLPVWSVGPRTARVARDVGFASVADANGDVTALATMVTRAQVKGVLLHPCGTHQAANLREMLAQSGVELRSCAIYKQNAVALSQTAVALLAADSPVLVPVFSPRSARLLRPYLQQAQAPLRVAALSGAVAEALDLTAPEALAIAEQPNGASMLNALIRLGAS